MGQPRGALRHLSTCLQSRHRRRRRLRVPWASPSPSLPATPRFSEVKWLDRARTVTAKVVDVPTPSTSGAHPWHPGAPHPAGLGSQQVRGGGAAGRGEGSSLISRRVPSPKVVFPRSASSRLASEEHDSHGVARQRPDARQVGRHTHVADQARVIASSHGRVHVQQPAPATNEERTHN
jgi:hypothetical protein